MFLEQRLALVYIHHALILENMQIRIRSVPSVVLAVSCWLSHYHTDGGIIC